MLSILVLIACQTDVGSIEPDPDACFASRESVGDDDLAAGHSPSQSLEWLQGSSPTSITWRADASALPSALSLTLTRGGDASRVSIEDEDGCPTFAEALEVPVAFELTLHDGELVATGTRHLLIPALDASRVVFSPAGPRQLNATASGDAADALEAWLTAEGHPVTGYQASIWLTGSWASTQVTVAVQDADDALSDVWVGDWMIP